ncbi:MAG TPA: DUF3857 domain-containing protein [Blastocatellia bacterium]|jgi:transglutaminase-like putative cysteine protease|nr:DUF3857 domain-containing protein [Blastocatellia bacterium]
MRISRISLLLPLAFVLRGDLTRAGSGWRPVTAQDRNITAADIGDPEADAAILFREGDLDDDDAEGTSLKVYVRIKVFTDRGRRYGDVQLPYRAELGRINDVHARTVHPDSKEFPVEGREIYDKLLVTTGHSIWRAKTFSMPSVEAGSIIEYRYRQTYPRGFRYFALDLQSELFIKELKYRIRPEAASHLEVRWTAFNNGADKQFKPVWDGGYIIDGRNIAPFRREPLMPPDPAVKMWGWLYYSKETERDPDKYWPDYVKSNFQAAAAQTSPTTLIKRIVGSITLSGDTPSEKLERIYHYVQSEIRNTGASVAQPGIQISGKVYGPEEVIRRRYGTSHEINRLFISMLRAAGIDARVAELTTRDENFFRRSFPDSFQLNSEVTAVIGPGGAPAFYDPGTPNCPIGLLAWEKEAVPALVYDREDPRFVDTPIAEAGSSLEDRTLVVTPLQDGRVTAHAELKVSGHRAMDLRGELSDLSLDQQRKRVVSGVREILPTAIVEDSSIKLSNTAGYEGPVELSCEFTAPGFALPTEKRLLLRPALLEHRDENLLPAPHRTNDIYFRYPWSEQDKVIVEIPEGYSEQLPENVTIDIGAARYDATFRREGRRIVYERKLSVNAIVFPAEQYSTVKSFFDRVYQADRAVISLER